jgi:hypothetical protein
VDFLRARLRVLQLECDASLADGGGGGSQGCGDTKDASKSCILIKMFVYKCLYLHRYVYLHACRCVYLNI